MTDEVGIPAPLDDVPATAKIVYLCLARADDPLTTQQIADWTRIPPRSVRSGINDLDADNLIGTDGDPVSPAYYLK